MTDTNSSLNSKDAPLLSLVILCYRSGSFVNEFVSHALEVLQEAKIDSYQLVLVANYVENSGDDTPILAMQIANENPAVVVVAKPKEGWMGWDMRSGLAMATGKYIAVIDGDGQMPVADVVRVFKSIRQNRLDFVKTFRLTRGDSYRRKIISLIYNTLFRILFPGLHCRDINSKPKMMTRAAYEKMNLKSDDWFIDAEIMLEVRRLKLRFGEIPTGFLGLVGRRSFVSWKTIFEFLANLCRYRLTGSYK